jgi:Spy/CpxP family protein refolding chaperone
MTTPPRRGSNRLKILLVLVGVFLLGGVTGASLASFYRLRGDDHERHERRGGGRGNREDKIFESMRRDLNLTEQQATEIRAILDQTRNDYRALRAEVRPRYDAVRQNARTRIRALLTPEQQKLFDARAAERDARRGDDEK